MTWKKCREEHHFLDRVEMFVSHINFPFMGCVPKQKDFSTDCMESNLKRNVVCTVYIIADSSQAEYCPNFTC